MSVVLDWMRGKLVIINKLLQVLCSIGEAVEYSVIYTKKY